MAKFPSKFRFRLEIDGLETEGFHEVGPVPEAEVVIDEPRTDVARGVASFQIRIPESPENREFWDWVRARLEEAEQAELDQKAQEEFARMARAAGIRMEPVDLEDGLFQMTIPEKENAEMVDLVKVALKPFLDRAIDPNCDVLELAGVTPLPIETWTDEQKGKVLEWCEAGCAPPLPGVLNEALEPLRKKGLLNPGF